MSRPPELLAPAGHPEALAAALQSGADAVYFGLDAGLNARARAGNFPLASLPDTMARIHRAGAQGYLTLNTLVFESELAEVERLVRAAAEAGVDALIVQDPAVALLARAVAPGLAVHASTQMTVSSPEALRFAQGLGCTRVVVPRELSLAEIRTMAEGAPVELEVFVHGALCMAWSGQCLTSEAWGGRSANRGQCAQSCRMPYELVVDGATRDLGDVRYLLSPRDLCGLDALPELTAIGVHSLKIEGRQKDAQYVATAVQAWRARLDGANVPVDRLLARAALSYSRGFSAGFFHGADHQTLVEGRFPKHRGVLVGEVTAVRGRELWVRQTHRGRADPQLAPRPGLGAVVDLGTPEVAEPGGPLYAVEATSDGWRVSFGAQGPDLTAVRSGHRLWLTGDPALQAETDRLVRAAEPECRIPVALRLWGELGLPLRAELSAEPPRQRQRPAGERVTVEGATGACLQSSTGAGLTEALLRDKVGALGGTPLRLAALSLTLPDGLHVPVTELKSLRRTLVAALLEALNSAHHHPCIAGPLLPSLLTSAPLTPAQSSPAAAPVLLPLCRTEAQLEAVIAAGLSEVELDWMELVGLTRAVERARAAGLRVTIATVRVQKPGEDGYDRRIARLQPDGVLVRHWGGLVTFAGMTDKPAVHGDFSLNVTNSLTAHHLLALGADTLTAAHDLDETQLHALLERVPAERVTVTVQHHIPTFHTEHCVYAHLLSQGKDFRTCGRPCEEHQLSLRDHQGLEHPVVVDVGCRNTVFNARAQSAAASVARLRARGVRRFRVEFVRESAAEAEAVLTAWQDLLAGRASAAEATRRAGAHEQFGVTAGTLRTMA
jgi:putative protease